MTDEQKQHYWAMFYCNAYTQSEQRQCSVDVTIADFVHLAECAPVKVASHVADAMLARMVERWPDKA
jgi:hypothetical protein